MKLYKLTNGIGRWWVVADHPTQAQEKLLKLLNKADCGFIRSREITNIELIATESDDERFLTNHFLVVK